ncbi:hypothetical protein GOP47_0016146 [Adiantum capillus-veneris]|uniref:Uncharacterized protein n=1 Tax=Adiantum capillus-veneris TaxID=13818 RepID=A0A9D4UL49_ADICA|nr:hypothetical protein GOP47_0016146 [Adiantum capillus-veneris]
MQGVGQLCLGGHVEGYFEVLEFVCSRGERAPENDSMETNTGAAYKGEVPCNEEGSANLAGDEVFEEQVEALAGCALKSEELVLMPILEDLDTGLQRDQVFLAMQQVEANCRVLLFYLMLWIHVLREVSLQVSLRQLQGFFEEDYTMEGSLENDRIAASGTGASSV